MAPGPDRPCLSAPAAARTDSGNGPCLGQTTGWTGNGSCSSFDSVVALYPPPGSPDAVQQVQDREHLRLLSIGHYVYAGITAVFSLIPLFHVGFGLLMALSPAFGVAPSGGGPPPQVFGLFFIVIGGAIILVGETFAVLNFLAGRFVKQRRSRVFILVVDAFNCLNVPLGTLLGVFTFVVMSRPSVRAQFEHGPADEAPVARWPEQV
jgi:hypothetical protein